MADSLQLLIGFVSLWSPCKTLNDKSNTNNQLYMFRKSLGLFLGLLK